MEKKKAIMSMIFRGSTVVGYKDDNADDPIYLNRVDHNKIEMEDLNGNREIFTIGKLEEKIQDILYFGDLVDSFRNGKFELPV